MHREIIGTVDQLTGFSGSPRLNDMILLPVPSLAPFWLLKSTDCCLVSSPQEIEGLNCASGVVDRPFSYQHTVMTEWNPPVQYLELLRRQSHH